MVWNDIKKWLLLYVMEREGITLYNILAGIAYQIIT
jgi:hypothetical protein